MTRLTLKISPRRENDRGRGERFNIGKMLGWVFGLLFLGFAAVGFTTRREIGAGIIAALVVGLLFLGFGLLSRREKTWLSCPRCKGMISKRTLICPHCEKMV